MLAQNPFRLFRIIPAVSIIVAASSAGPAVQMVHYYTAVQTALIDKWDENYSILDDIVRGTNTWTRREHR